MKRFMQEVDRNQTTLLPECLDDYVNENNSVRFIEAFHNINANHSHFHKSIFLMA